jgi:hypothetical protein
VRHSNEAADVRFELLSPLLLEVRLDNREMTE